MTEPTTQAAEKALIVKALKGHHRDNFSQDSGDHCACGSDSRFEQRDGDHPWSSMEEHRADMVLRALGSGGGRRVRTSPVSRGSESDA